MCVDVCWCLLLLLLLLFVVMTIVLVMKDLCQREEKKKLWRLKNSKLFFRFFSSMPKSFRLAMSKMVQQRHFNNAFLHVSFRHLAPRLPTADLPGSRFGSFWPPAVPPCCWPRDRLACNWPQPNVFKIELKDAKYLELQSWKMCHYEVWDRVKPRDTQDTPTPPNTCLIHRNRKLIPWPGAVKRAAWISRSLLSVTTRELFPTKFIQLWLQLTWILWPGVHFVQMIYLQPQLALGRPSTTPKRNCCLTLRSGTEVTVFGSNLEQKSTPWTVESVTSRPKEVLPASLQSRQTDRWTIWKPGLFGNLRSKKILNTSHHFFSEHKKNKNIKKINIFFMKALTCLLLCYVLMMLFLLFG